MKSPPPSPMGDRPDIRGGGGGALQGGRGVSKMGLSFSALHSEFHFSPAEVFFWFGLREWVRLIHPPPTWISPGAYPPVACHQALTPQFPVGRKVLTVVCRLLTSICRVRCWCVPLQLPPQPSKSWVHGSEPKFGRLRAPQRVARAAAGVGWDEASCPRMF